MEVLAKRSRQKATDAQEEEPKKPRSRPLMLHDDALRIGAYRAICEMEIAEAATEGQLWWWTPETYWNPGDANGDPTGEPWMVEVREEAASSGHDRQHEGSTGAASAGGSQIAPQTTEAGRK